MENLIPENQSQESPSLKDGIQHLRVLLEFRANELIGNTGKINCPDIDMKMEYPERIFLSLIEKYRPTEEEQIFLVLLLLPLYHPEWLDVFSSGEFKAKVPASITGGYFQAPTRGFQPTFRTFLFLLGRNDHKLYKLISPDHYFIKDGIIKPGEIPPGAIPTDVPLSLSEEYYHLFTIGHYEPRLSSNFPAQRLTSTIGWDDLILNPRTLQYLNDLRIQIRQYGNLTAMPMVKRRMAKGLRALLYGDPGTGKTESIAILGQELNRPVYRVNISTIVSKYVGETEKNMEALFNMAEGRDWILFFDEADALFGKRSNVDSSQDRFANQQVSYLLQRVEDYNGMLLLATNKYLDMDEAFSRRLQFKIEFPKPTEEERVQMWLKFFNNIEIPLSPDVKISDFSWREVTGGMLKNIFTYVLSQVSERKGECIIQEDLEKALYEEYYKERKEWRKEKPNLKQNPILVKGSIN